MLCTTLILTASSFSFTVTSFATQGIARCGTLVCDASTGPVDMMQLDVVNDAEEVATVVCNRLEAAAAAAIAERGHFALCAPPDIDSRFLG